MNFYNDIDPKSCAWLGELMDSGLIPPGVIDNRSITEIDQNELTRYTQCHFFAGIGGWPLALHWAGWPEDRPVWTGSCPCQPFSVAGKRKGEADERHIWPAFRDLIAKCQPPVVFGEQVASKDGREWLVGVRADLEGMGYAVGAADLCAAGVGAPHLRQRLYWVADAKHDGRRADEPGRGSEGRAADGRFGGMANADGRESRNGELQRGGQHGQQSQDGGSGWRRVSFAADCPDGDAETGEPGNTCAVCGGEYSECGCPGPTQDGYEYVERDGILYARRLADMQCPGLEGHTGDGRDGDEPGRDHKDQAGSVAKGGATGSVGNSDGAGCSSCGSERCGEESRPQEPQNSGEHGPLGDPTSGGRGECGDASQPGRGGHVERAGWARFEIVHCRDGKARRFEPGSFPLAHGVPGRVGLLRGYGNAIVPQVAAEFVSAFMEVTLPPTANRRIG